MQMRTVPTGVATLDQLETGRGARVSAVLGSAECPKSKWRDLRAGTHVRCIARLPEHILIRTAGGRFIPVQWSCAAYVQIERDAMEGTVTGHAPRRWSRQRSLGR